MARATLEGVSRVIPLAALVQLRTRQCGIDRTYAVAWIRDVKRRTADEAAAYGAGFEEGYQKALLAVNQLGRLDGA